MITRASTCLPMTFDKSEQCVATQIGAQYRNVGVKVAICTRVFMIIDNLLYMQSRLCYHEYS